MVLYDKMETVRREPTIEVTSARGECAFWDSRVTGPKGPHLTGLLTGVQSGHGVQAPFGVPKRGTRWQRFPVSVGVIPVEVHAILRQTHCRSLFQESLFETLFGFRTNAEQFLFQKGSFFPPFPD